LNLKRNAQESSDDNGMARNKPRQKRSDWNKRTPKERKAAQQLHSKTCYEKKQSTLAAALQEVTALRAELAQVRSELVCTPNQLEPGSFAIGLHSQYRYQYS
jgi:hypothetical protein